MSKRRGLYPRVRVDARGSGVVSQAGGLLLVDAARAGGLGRASGLSEALAPWPHNRLARHYDPRPRSSWIWRSRSGWVGIVWLMSRCCVRSRGCSGRWPRIRRCRARFAVLGCRRCEGVDGDQRGARRGAREWSGRQSGEYALDVGVDADNPIVVEHRRHLADGPLRQAGRGRQRSSGAMGLHPLWRSCRRPRRRRHR